MNINQALKHFFGFDSFRMNQKEIIDNIIQKQDILALLPTGGGKSIIYQLPALISNGVCLVISPLLALMKDQVNQLEKKGIESAYISSEMSLFDVQKNLEKAQKNKIKILYISPERISNFHFINALKYIQISFIAVDEAHCVSEWGSDFRPSYQNIQNFRNQFKNVNIIALTATANQKTVDDIILKLGLKKIKIFKNSFVRKNISNNFIETENKINYIIYLLKKHIGSGLIYCRTRKETENLYHILKDKNLLVDYFHAGLTTFEKQKKQQSWTSSNYQTLICTNAFGMGIDKPNVHLIIHLDPPYSIENYYQEVGRAGRDSQESYSYMLWNHKDLDKWKSNLLNNSLTKKEYEKIIKSLFSFFLIAEGEKTENTYFLEVKDFAKKIKISKTKVNTILKTLHSFNLIYFKDSNTESKIKFKCNPQDINYLENTRYQIIEFFSRKIMGIFSNEISFSEDILTQYLGIKKEELQKELTLLQQENWIEYFPCKGSSIIFLQQRKDDFWINHTFKKINDNQQNNLQKFKEFEFLITQNKHCRNKLILGYFNEKSEDCNNCDVCLSKQKIKLNRKLRLEIYKFIEQKPCTLQDIFLEFITENQDEIIENIHTLLNENIIKNKDFITYQIKD